MTQENHQNFAGWVVQGRRILEMWWVALACAIGAATASAAQLRFEPNAPVILHQGTGSTAFILTNPGDKPVTLGLRAGQLSDSASQTPLPPATVSFAAQSGGPLPAEVFPGGALAVEASMSHVSGAAVANEALLNGATELGKLQVVDGDAPLDISISGNGSFDQQLVLADGDDAVLTIRNGDDESYPLDWSFQIAGKTMQSGELQLAAHGSSRIELTPTDDFYTWTDDLRPSSRTGTLVVSLHGPAEVAKELLPQRTLQANLLMRKLSPGQTSLLSHLIVVILVLLGGLLSVVANSVLPTVLRKISLRRQLAALADRVSSIGAGVDPFLRNLLAMERKRVDLLLKGVRFLSLSSVETLDEGSESIEQLSKRLNSAERLHDLRRRLEDASTGPPSVTEDIDNKLQIAANQLHSFAVTDQDLIAANGYMDAANAALDTLGDTYALAQRIAANFRELQVRQKLLPPSHYEDLKTALPGLFELLNQPFDDPASITRPMMFSIDFGISALQLAFDYAVMRVSTPAAVAVPISGASPGQSARERLLARHEEMVELLGTLSAAALRGLRTLVQEMRENVYERDVLEEIARHGQAEIIVDPQTVRRYSPVLFSIRFKDPRFRSAAAMRRLMCKWDFPNHLVEQQWKVAHFFEGNEKSRDEEPGLQISVRVESQKPAGRNGNDKDASKLLRTVLTKTIEVQRREQDSYARNFAEGVRFFIALGVALAALFSGALQQLDKLDFLPAMIAVLVLGFGADTVKNLLTQTARRAAI